MNNSSDEETFEKLNISPFFAKNLLVKEDIDLAPNLFNDTKFQPLDSLYSSDKLITFLHISQKIVFLFFI